MIGVSEESKIQAAGTPAELHEILGGSVGRLLRIRTILQFNRGDSYRGIAPYTELVYDDEIAELKSLKLRRTLRYRGRRTNQEPARDHISLEIELKGSPRSSLDLDNSLVELFQADSGSWKLIHRGKEWTPRSEHFEKKENGR